MFRTPLTHVDKYGTHSAPQCNVTTASARRLNRRGAYMSRLRRQRAMLDQHTDARIDSARRRRICLSLWGTMSMANGAW